MIATRSTSRTWLAVAVLSGAMTLAPLAASAQDAAAEPLPDAGTELAPGRYGSDAVGPTVNFRVDDGWAVSAAPPGPIFALERTDQPGTVLTVTRFDGETYVDSCDSTSLTDVDAGVERLAEIIGGNPYLNPAAPQPITVDGNPGIQLDVAVPPYTECALPFVLLWALPIGDGGEFVQVADQQSRFVILDVDGDVIVVAIESFPGVPFGGLLDESMKLVESMRIEPGEYIPPEETSGATPTPQQSAAPEQTAAPTSA